MEEEEGLLDLNCEKIREGGMGGACSTYGEMMCTEL
jgi:hypothetical protein